MADLFDVIAPVLILHRDTGARHVMAERFPLAGEDGLVYFELYWHLQRPATRAIHRVAGAIEGEGPWRVGNSVVRVLGCQGTDPDLAAAHAEWQSYLRQGAPGYPDRQVILALAADAGARIAFS